MPDAAPSPVFSEPVVVSEPPVFDSVSSPPQAESRSAATTQTRSDERPGAHDLEASGLDVHGLDVHGLDVHGLDAHGLDAHGSDAGSLVRRTLFMEPPWPEGAARHREESPSPVRAELG